MEVFIHLPDAEQSRHTPEKNNCVLTETKQPSLELGPGETLSPAALRFTLQGAAAGGGAESRTCCLLPRGARCRGWVPAIAIWAAQTLVLQTAHRAPWTDRRLGSMRKVGRRDLLASSLVKSPKSHLVAGNARRWFMR